jgi:hypothetical protein
MTRVGSPKSDSELVEPVRSTGPAGKARRRSVRGSARKMSTARHCGGRTDEIGSHTLVAPATTPLIRLLEEIHSGDEALLPDLASACHRAVLILLRRHDLFQYSAIVSDIGHGLWRDADGGSPPHAEAPILQESFDRLGPGSDQSSY